MNQTVAQFRPPIYVWILVVGAPMVCLLPFVTKAFHVDDTLFVWTAKQILAHPLDFYGFSANWYGNEMPMAHIQQNPPLVSYYIALVELLFGWNEITIHLAFFIPAIATSVGILFLAKPLCRMPHVAVLLAVLTPAFLVSSTNVMSDMFLLALYVWTITLYVRGLDLNQHYIVILAMIFASLAVLAKYFGITLVPLLLAYSIAKRRKFDGSILYLLIPIAVALGYEWLTLSLYDRGLFSHAALYSVSVGISIGHDLIPRILTGLSFTGGALISAAFVAPLLWSRRAWTLFIPLLGVSAFLILLMGKIGPVTFVGADHIKWEALLLLSVFITAGAHILILAADDLLTRRDPISLMLFLWVLGTFMFATFFNWTTNVRSVLPMTPAVAIFVMRKYDRCHQERNNHRWQRMIAPLTASAVLAFGVAWADFSLANCQRAAVKAFQSSTSDQSGSLWFQGHWGFQYYMELIGGKPVNMEGTSIKPGDLMLIPKNNTNVGKVNSDFFRHINRLQMESSPWIATISVKLGAGFYSSLWGPLPFAFGRVPPEQYDLYVVEALKKRSSSH